MKAIKIIVGLLIAVIAVVAIVVVIGLQNINKIVKTAVETVGPDVTKTEVRLAEVDIQLMQGRGELRGLTVANPQGFSRANAFSLGEIALQIDPASLTGDVIVINEIVITGAQLLAEHKNIKDTNLQALFDNVSGNENNQTSSSQASTTDASQQVKLAIEQFTFSASEIKLMTEKWGERSVKLPTIRGFRHVFQGQQSP